MQVADVSIPVRVIGSPMDLYELRMMKHDTKIRLYQDLCTLNFLISILLKGVAKKCSLMQTDNKRSKARKPTTAKPPRITGVNVTNIVPAMKSTGGKAPRDGGGNGPVKKPVQADVVEELREVIENMKNAFTALRETHDRAVEEHVEMIMRIRELENLVFKLAPDLYKKSKWT